MTEKNLEPTSTQHQDNFPENNAIEEENDQLSSIRSSFEETDGPEVNPEKSISSVKRIFSNLVSTLKQTFTPDNNGHNNGKDLSASPVVENDGFETIDTSFFEFNHQELINPETKQSSNYVEEDSLSPLPGIETQNENVLEEIPQIEFSASNMNEDLDDSDDIDVQDELMKFIAELDTFAEDESPEIADNAAFDIQIEGSLDQEEDTLAPFSVPSDVEPDDDSLLRDTASWNLHDTPYDLSSNQEDETAEPTNIWSRPYLDDQETLPENENTRNNDPGEIQTLRGLFSSSSEDAEEAQFQEEIPEPGNIPPTETDNLFTSVKFNSPLEDEPIIEVIDDFQPVTLEDFKNYDLTKEDASKVFLLDDEEKIEAENETETPYDHSNFPEVFEEKKPEGNQASSVFSSDLRSLFDENDQQLENEENTNGHGDLLSEPSNESWGDKAVITAPSIEQESLLDKITHTANLDKKTSRVSKFLKNLRQNFSSWSLNQKVLALSGAVIGLLCLNLIAFFGLRALIIPHPSQEIYASTGNNITDSEAAAVYPTSVKLPGGWIFNLQKSHIEDNEWKPITSEWLEGSHIRRIIAIPWNKQTEAVINSFETGDKILLFMSNEDFISYEIEDVSLVSKEDTDIYKGTKPSLVIILYNPDSDERWVVSSKP